MARRRKTTIGVAALRAVESRRPDRLFNDPYAQAFVEAGRAVFPELEDFGQDGNQRSLAGLGALFYSYVAVRTRFYDDYLLAATAARCDQVVLLAAVQLPDDDRSSGSRFHDGRNEREYGMTKAVTVLGTGIMGAGMARSLIRAGLDVTVWNRSTDKARALERDGASVARDVTSAVSGADAVLTMLFDADAVAAVMEQALPAVDRSAVWVQTSTVGLDGTARLARLADQHGIGFVDAPVLGTRKPAEEGALIVLAAGPAQLRDTVAPLFDAIGSRVVWVGERPGDGHRLKLVANSWVLSVVGGTAQAISLAEGFDLDPALFLDAISGGTLDCAYTQVKGRAMIAGDFSPAFTLDGALKDSALIAEAMHAAGTADGLMQALHREFLVAAHAGHDAEDMAAVINAFRR